MPRNLNAMPVDLASSSPERISEALLMLPPEKLVAVMQLVMVKAGPVLGQMMEERVGKTPEEALGRFMRGGLRSIFGS